jgi:hypothetical protein
MSISSTTSRNDYLGNNAVAIYPYTFRIFRKQDIRVIKRNLSDVEFVLAEGVDFTVSNVNNPAGGNITLLAGNLPTDFKLTFRRVLQLKQETDIRNQGDFLPEVHENQFDRDVMIAQQLTDDVSRSMRTVETISPADFSPILPADIQTPDRALVTNPTGTGFVLGLSGTDATRIFNEATYAALKAQAVAAPAQQRWGWATDILQLVFYTGNLSVGDAGWIVVGG